MPNVVLTSYDFAQRDAHLFIPRRCVSRVAPPCTKTTPCALSAACAGTCEHYRGRPLTKYLQWRPGLLLRGARSISLRACCLAALNLISALLENCKRDAADT